MILAVSVGYVAAGAAMLAAALLRRDRRVIRRLGAAPTARVPLLERIGRRVPVRLGPAVRARIADLEMSSDAVAGLRGRKVLLGAAGTVLGGALTGWGAGALAVAPLLAATGYRLPDLGLAGAVAARGRALATDVPQFLEVLAVSVSAGLSPRVALDRAPDAVSGPLALQLRRARDEVALGAPWRRAVRMVADRTGSSDLRRLAVTLDRSERLGSPVGERLQALAREVRTERRSRREERARRAPVQMLFPLVFLILPAFVVAAVVPAVIVATRGLS